MAEGGGDAHAPSAAATAGPRGPGASGGNEDSASVDAGERSSPGGGETGEGRGAHATAPPLHLHPHQHQHQHRHQQPSRDREQESFFPQLPTTPGVLPTIGTGALNPISTTPSVTLVSPHPRPSYIECGSSTSRQLYTGRNSQPGNHDKHLRDPTSHGPCDDLASSPQPHPQPQTAPLESAASSSAPTSNNTQGHDPAGSHKMIFTDLYKSPRSPLSKLRHVNHPVLAPDSADYDADLVSKDKARQKEAVKRHLQAKVRNDWTFTWPPETRSPVIAEPRPLGAGGDAADGDVEGYLEVASQASETNQEEAVEGEETALDSGEEADSDSEAGSVYSTMSEDPLHWRPRLEWASELSEDELPYNSPSPFKFDTPDSIGQAVTASKIARKARRRKELRKEMAWNDGLACFEARRNAWTGAKVARVRPKPPSPVSPVSPRRALFWRARTYSSSNAGQPPASPSLASPLTPSNSQPEAARAPSAGADSDNVTPPDNLSPKTSRSDSQKAPEILPVETLLPVPPPLLPPANPMRASINPSLYNSIYEKVVVHSLQPSCPINLGDMVRACVSGWKRDGEWPPRPAAPEPAALVAIKRKKSTVPTMVSSTTQNAQAPGRKMSFSFLNSHGDKEKARRESAAGADEGSGASGTGKALRRSLQKVLGIGHSPTIASVGDGHAGAQEH